MGRGSPTHGKPTLRGEADTTNTRASEQASQQRRRGGGHHTGALVGIIVAAALAVVGIGCSCILITKEKAGKPIFSTLNEKGNTV